MKITTEIQRNVKTTITSVKQESNLFNVNREKYNFAPKLDAATLVGAHVHMYVYGQC